MRCISTFKSRITTFFYKLNFWSLRSHSVKIKGLNNYLNWFQLISIKINNSLSTNNFL
jgi:hypothetical protein